MSLADISRWARRKGQASAGATFAKSTEPRTRLRALVATPACQQELARLQSEALQDLQHDPTDAAASGSAGLCAEKRGLFGAAVAHLRDAGAADPDGGWDAHLVRVERALRLHTLRRRGEEAEPVRARQVARVAAADLTVEEFRHRHTHPAIKWRTPYEKATRGTTFH